MLVLKLFVSNVYYKTEILKVKRLLYIVLLLYAYHFNLTFKLFFRLTGHLMLERFAQHVQEVDIDLPLLPQVDR